MRHESTLSRFFYFLKSGTAEQEEPIHDGEPRLALYAHGLPYSSLTGLCCGTNHQQCGTDQRQRGLVRGLLYHRNHKYVLSRFFPHFAGAN